VVPLGQVADADTTTDWPAFTVGGLTLTVTPVQAAGVLTVMLVVASASGA
jgi:hypothetical protein